jgi:tRNA A37 threonylcarbamoyladenosine dehydratase
VVDAIDSVTNKIDLIVCAHNKGLNIVSAMGAGNRTQIPYFEVSDIYKTYNDGLAKIMRKKLKEKNIENHTVVFSKLTATPVEGQVGSISYYPAMCGCVLAAYVINKLIEQ